MTDKGIFSRDSLPVEYKYDYIVEVSTTRRQVVLETLRKPLLPISICFTRTSLRDKHHKKALVVNPCSFGKPVFFFLLISLKEGVFHFQVTNVFFSHEKLLKEVVKQTDTSSIQVFLMLQVPFLHFLFS